MARDREFWRAVLRDYDPYATLDRAQMAHRYAPRRSLAASDELYQELDLAMDPRDLSTVRYLLAGARGSGKTTELLRLHARLEGHGQAIAAPIYLDIAAVLPEHATTVTWLPILAAAVAAATESWTGKKVGAERRLRAVEAFAISADLFTKALRTVGSIAKWGGPDAALLGAASDAASETTEALSQLTGAVGDVTAADVNALVTSIHEDLRALADHVGRPPLLLLDGLDNRATVESVLDALDGAELLYKLPCALVVAAPAQLALDGRFAAHLMPGALRPLRNENLPVVHHDGAPKDVGIDVLVDLFNRRWAGPAEPSFLPPDLVEGAARWSSGIVREFLELVRQTALATLNRGLDVATDDELRAAVRKRRQDYEATLTTEGWDQLARVLETGERPKIDMDELLLTNKVASYPNDGIWFRPNELLVPHLEARRERRST